MPSAHSVCASALLTAFILLQQETQDASQQATARRYAFCCVLVPDREQEVKTLAAIMHLICYDPLLAEMSFE